MELRQSQEPNHCIPNGSKAGSLTDQEKTHSVKSRQEEVKETQELQKFQKFKSLEAVNWPPMNDSLRREEFEKLVVGQLIENADAMKKLRLMEVILYTEAVNTFGVIVQKVNHKRKSRREAKLSKLKKERKKLLKVLKQTII